MAKVARTGKKLAKVVVLAALVIPSTAYPSRAGDGVVKLQSADPACGDDSGAIYVDCGNGTVTDNRTGLVWLQNAACFEHMTLGEAMRFVAGLGDVPEGEAGSDSDCGLSDGSAPGEWRLPTVDEWEAMIADADGGPGELDCIPRFTNDDGTACWNESCHTAGFCAFTGIDASVTHYYPSGSIDTADPSLVWKLNPVDMVMTDQKELTSYTDLAWPVRAGQ